MKIGVCLASYNGELFIKEQIVSVLKQLSTKDVLVVSDDNSTDRTLNIVNSIKDSRICLIKNIESTGYVKNFERGLTHMANYFNTDLIFLCDQDDVWEANKIRRVVEVFNRDSRVSFVCHKLRYVNKDLSPLKNKINQRINYDRFFLFRSFIRPKAFGCGMAFKTKTLIKSIPFPQVVYTHDHWIEIIGYFSGSCVYLDEYLIKYRRHTSSLTEIMAQNKQNRLIDSILNIIKFRVLFIGMVLMALLKSWKK